MDAKIEGGFLHIKIPVQTPSPSASGKSLVVASTKGNATTTAQVDLPNGGGKRNLVVGLNAYIKP